MSQRIRILKNQKEWLCFVQSSEWWIKNVFVTTTSKAEGWGRKREGKEKKETFAGRGGEVIIYAFQVCAPRYLPIATSMHSTLFYSTYSTYCTYSTLLTLLYILLCRWGQGRGCPKLRYPTCIGGTIIWGNYYCWGYSSPYASCNIPCAHNKPHATAVLSSN